MAVHVPTEKKFTKQKQIYTVTRTFASKIAAAQTLEPAGKKNNFV
jgi:hypothetical protein